MLSFSGNLQVIFCPFWSIKAPRLHSLKLFGIKLWKRTRCVIWRYDKFQFAFHWHGSKLTFWGELFLKRQFPPRGGGVTYITCMLAETCPKQPCNLAVHSISCSRLHDEWPHIRVGREGGRAGCWRPDATSVYTQRGEGSALLHQALQHRLVALS